jgi:hypothetical protein
MLVKNAQIANDAVVQAINTLASAKIPARAGFILAQNLEMISKLAETYEKQRVKLVEEFAEKDADGKPVTVPAENGRTNIKLDPARVVEFNKQFEELLNVETELALKKIKLDDIGAVELTTGELANILWLIDG